MFYFMQSLNVHAQFVSYEEKLDEIDEGFDFFYTNSVTMYAYDNIHFFQSYL